MLSEALRNLRGALDEGLREGTLTPTIMRLALERLETAERLAKVLEKAFTEAPEEMSRVSEKLSHMAATFQEQAANHGDSYFDPEETAGIALYLAHLAKRARLLEEGEGEQEGSAPIDAGNVLAFDAARRAAPNHQPTPDGGGDAA